MNAKKILSLIMAVVFSMGFITAIPAQADTSAEDVVFFEGFDGLENGDVNGQDDWLVDNTPNDAGSEVIEEIVDYGLGKAVKFTREHTEDQYQSKLIKSLSVPTVGSGEMVSFSWDYIPGSNKGGLSFGFGFARIGIYAQSGSVNTGLDANDSRPALIWDKSEDAVIRLTNNNAPLSVRKHHFEITYVPSTLEVAFYWDGKLVDTGYAQKALTLNEVCVLSPRFFGIGEDYADNIKVAIQKLPQPISNRIYVAGEDFSSMTVNESVDGKNGWTLDSSGSTVSEYVGENAAFTTGRGLRMSRTVSNTATYRAIKTINTPTVAEGEKLAFSWEYLTNGSGAIAINFGWGNIDIYPGNGKVATWQNLVNGASIKWNSTNSEEMYLTGEAELMSTSIAHKFELIYDPKTLEVELYWNGDLVDTGKAAAALTINKLRVDSTKDSGVGNNWFGNIKIEKIPTIQREYVNGEDFSSMTIDQSVNGINGWVLDSGDSTVQEYVGENASFANGRGLRFGRTNDDAATYRAIKAIETPTVADGEKLSFSWEYLTSGTGSIALHFGWGYITIAPATGCIGTWQNPVAGATIKWNSTNSEEMYLTGDKAMMYTSSSGTHKFELVYDPSSLEVELYWNGALVDTGKAAAALTIDKIRIDSPKNSGVGNNWIGSIKIEKIKPISDEVVIPEVERAQFTSAEALGREYTDEGAKYTAGFGATVTAEKSNFVVIEAVKDNVMQKKYIESGFTATGDGDIDVAVKIIGVPADVIIAVALSDMAE